MKKEILRELSQLTRKHDIKVLLAVESGSRAWGFPSPDSDYDVRLVYQRPLKHYLSLIERKDTLSLPPDAVLDVEGWDLRKILVAMGKSNAVVFEWLQSPIVYQQLEGFRDRLWELAPACFNPKRGLHHYLSLAGKAREASRKNGQVNLKKLFYVLRSLLAARWIHTHLTVPPMELQPLRDLVPQQGPLPGLVDQLLELKSRSGEKSSIDPILELERWIDTEMAIAEKATSSVPDHKPDLQLLDEFFRQQILAV